MPKALLFDLDGTLPTTDAVHLPNWIEVLRPYGVEVKRELYEEKLSGRVDKEAVEDACPTSPTKRWTSCSRGRNYASGKGRVRSAPPGLRGLIEAGRRRGLPLALVTNSNEEDAGEILQPLGLQGVFDPVVYPQGGEDSKPAALPYEQALESLGSSANARACAIVGIATRTATTKEAPEATGAPDAGPDPDPDPVAGAE